MADFENYKGENIPFGEPILSPSQRSIFFDEVLKATENSIWNNLLYFNTLFESLNGYTTTGTVAISNVGVAVRASGAGSESYFYKTPISQAPVDGFLSFDKPSRFRLIFTSPAINSQQFFFTIGTNETEDVQQDHYGFFVDEAIVYGLCGNANGTQIINLGFNIVADKTYEFEANYKSGKGIVFSIDKTMRGGLANKLPKGDFSNAVDFFPHFAVRSKTATLREFTVSFFEYLQRRF